jgi:hypothetical protein
MALTVTSGLTEIDDCNVDDWTGDPTVGLDTDFQIYETGCIGIDVDIETHHMYGSTFTAADYSNRVIYVWILSFSGETLDTKAAGGIRIALSDGTNESYWYVGGGDTYAGGWEVFTCNTAVSPDANNGTNATLTSITNVGVGFKNLAKSKLSQNCFTDWNRYGSIGAAALTVTGTNTTTGEGWSEVKTGDDTGVFGILKQQKGSYILKGPVEFGDSVGTASLNFTDNEATSIVFDDFPVGNVHYNVTIVGNATGTTDFQLGDVVGTGDDRQGVLGSQISTLGPLWEWDSFTDIADLDTVELYGCQFSGAGAGIGVDDNTKTELISCTLTNCGALDLGTTNNGAEVLNCFIIDPDGATNNYGMNFPQTPSVGELTHNAKNVNFITSGTPATQYMLAFPYAGDYDISLVGFKFFGSYTSGTLWHGINTGLNADVTINASGQSDPVQAEFSSTNGGTVTVVNTVTLQVTVQDSADSSLLEDVLVSIRNASTNALVSQGRTNASGVYSDGSYNYGGDLAVNIETRKSSPGDTRYFPKKDGATIVNTGLLVTAQLTEDTNAGIVESTRFDVSRHGQVSNDVSGTALTARIRLPSGSNRKLVVGCGYWDAAADRAISTLTYDGNAMTGIITANSVTESTLVHEMFLYRYDIPNTDSGIKDVVMTLDGVAPIRFMGFAVINLAATGAQEDSGTSSAQSVTSNPSITLNNTTQPAIDIMFSVTDDLDTFPPTASGVGSIRRSDKLVSGDLQLTLVRADREATGSHSLGATYDASSKTYVSAAAAFAD